jgi:uncharacterized membrane protein HdeD (DUF308 family)
MSTNATLIGLEQVRPCWGWFLALGIILMGIGVMALAFIPVATLGSVLVLGWLMVAGGVLEGVYAFYVRGWGGVLLHVLGAVLGILVGLIVVTHPVAGALAWTLLFAAYFTVIGIFRTIAAIQLKYQSWGWAVFDGIVTLVLGLLLWAEWPASAIWFLGLALGIALILRGWTMVMFALAVRALTRRVLLERAA